MIHYVQYLDMFSLDLLSAKVYVNSYGKDEISRFYSSVYTFKLVSGQQSSKSKDVFVQ